MNKKNEKAEKKNLPKETNKFTSYLIGISYKVGIEVYLNKQGIYVIGVKLRSNSHIPLPLASTVTTNMTPPIQINRVNLEEKKHRNNQV